MLDYGYFDATQGPNMVAQFPSSVLWSQFLSSGDTFSDFRAQPGGFGTMLYNLHGSNIIRLLLHKSVADASCVRLYDDLLLEDRYLPDNAKAADHEHYSVEEVRLEPGEML